MTQRSTEWKAAVQVLKEEPKILLFGQPELKIMDKVNAKIMSPLAHMHNSFMQQLMFLGMPGVFEPIFYPIMAFSTTMFLLMAGLFLGSYEELNKFGTEEN